MRYLPFVLFAASLFAQTPPPPAASLQTGKLPLTMKQGKNDETFFGIRKFFPSTKSVKLPVFGLLPSLPKTEALPFGDVVVSQRGPCAIPLTNVLPPSPSATIRRIPVPDAKFPI